MTVPPDKPGVASLAVPQVKSSSPTGRVARVLRYIATPVMLGLAAFGLYLWVQSRDLDSIEQRTLNADRVTTALLEHLELVAFSTVFVIVIAVALGVLLTRPWARRATPFVIGLTNMGQAIPSIGLLVLLAILFGIGFWQVIVALVAYSMLPVLRNTMVGLQQVDRSLIEAGRGMGMTKASVLRRIELPLAVPVMLAGIRTALIINVGTATLATFVGTGGFGDFINNGLRLGRPDVVFVGGAMTAILALTIDWIGSVAEDLLRPKGL